MTKVLFNLFFTYVLTQMVQDLEEGLCTHQCYDGSMFDQRRLTAKTKTLTSFIQEALFVDDCVLMAQTR